MTFEEGGSTDTTLIERCRQGDGQAWELLVERYQRLVYSIPRRAGLDNEQVADVFQQVFVALFENIHRLENPDRLAAWLATTARRESWRISRQQRTTNAVTLPGARDEQDTSPLDMVPDTALLPDEQLEQLEQQHIIRQKVMTLDDRCRTLLTMLFYQADPPSYHDIASTLQMSVGSVGAIRARCLQKLRQSLEKVGF
jgi:RNA polymerase sigma factor (sigma-70 family)